MNATHRAFFQDHSVLAQDYAHHRPSPPPPTRKRKRLNRPRLPPPVQPTSHPHSPNVIVLIGHNHPPSPHSLHHPSPSKPALEFDDRRSEDEFFLEEASKSQLLRLRRDHLLRLLAPAPCPPSPSPPSPPFAAMTKEALAALIIHSRINRTANPRPFHSSFPPRPHACRSLVLSKENHRIDSGGAHAPCFGNEDPDPSPSGGHTGYRSRSTLPRTKSLPSHALPHPAGLAGLLPTSQPKNALLPTLHHSHQPFELDASTIRSGSRQRTKMAVQREEAACCVDGGSLKISGSARRRVKGSVTDDNPPSFESYEACSWSNSSSWCSSSQTHDLDPSCSFSVDGNLDTTHKTPRDPSCRATPNRRYLRRTRRVVKFTGPKPATHPDRTPIAHRTRHGSNASQPVMSRRGREASPRGTKRTQASVGSGPELEQVAAQDIIMRSARKLRNGKVIRATRRPSKLRLVSASGTGGANLAVEDDSGEEQRHMSEEEASTQETLDGESQPDSEDMFSLAGSCKNVRGSPCESSLQPDSDVDEGEDGSDEEDGYDESLDLSQATSKVLLRLRRNNLVKMCEERELEAAGTKKDLVQSLLQWRDTNEVEGMSHSSVGSKASVGGVPSDGMSPTYAVKEDKVEDDSRSGGRAVEEDKPGVGSQSHPISLCSSAKQNVTQPSGIQSREEVTSSGNQRKSHRDDIGELLDLESLNLQDKEIQADQLKKMELIGSGGFKDVYKGIYRRIPVAIADIRGHLTEMDVKELKILRDLRHENIVRFIGVSVPSEESKSMIPIMIVSELCTNGDLFDYIRNVPNPGLAKVCGILKDIAKGLDYLHSRVPAIIHRDLKSSNVLITARGVAKLNDFGLARIKNSTRSLVKSLVGTVNWQAPELWVAHPRYNEKVDVYSAGLVAWEMLQWHNPVKRYPFEGQNEHAIYQDVGTRHLRPATAGMRRQWGGEIVDLVEKLWKQNPADRPKMKEVIKELEEILSACQ